MALLRTAFECDNGIVQMAVLCAGCYAELVMRMGGDDRRSWSRPMDGGTCEFCLDTIRESALR